MHASASPYRKRQRDELELSGEPLFTRYVWIAWFTAVGLVALVMGIESVSRVRVLAGAALAILVSLLIALRLEAGRVRWKIALEGSDLRVERIVGNESETLGTLDVSDGVELAVVVDSEPTALDARLVLSAGDDQVEVRPGADLDVVSARVLVFLRDHAVRVTTAS